LAAVGLWAVAASADQDTGTISKIDLARNTFMVDGIYFAAGPSNTVGAHLSRFEEGDKVIVQYAGDWAIAAASARLLGAASDDIATRWLGWSGRQK
jgi:hypothetical protein